jgi:hypothetical protein
MMRFVRYRAMNPRFEVITGLIMEVVYSGRYVPKLGI